MSSEFKDNLKLARKLRGLSQGEVADGIGVARDRTADRIAAIERKLSRLKELYINDLIDIETYKADRAALLAEIEDLQGRATEGRTKAADSLRGLLSPDLWSLYADFTPEEKRRFWRGIIERIEFGKDRSINVIFL